MRTGSRDNDEEIMQGKQERYNLRTGGLQGTRIRTGNRGRRLNTMTGIRRSRKNEEMERVTRREDIRGP